MLRTLSIQDFVIVDAIELERPAPGFSVFTGETGAGKSILIDALALALGGRGDAERGARGRRPRRYTAEFAVGQLTCLVQHEFFHRYTADEHTLLCIDKLDALINTTDPKLIAYRHLFENLEDPFVLYLALLLHDTGRAVGARPHSEASAFFAQSVAKRLQLSPEQRKSLILLVDHHVTLSNTAQQRNLDDPATIFEFANIIRTQKNLHALMLLTLADGQGTSGQSWSDWKESLVWQLFHATSQYLTDQKSYLEQTKIERDTLQAAVAAELPPDYADEVDAHFDFMPDNYFRAFDVPDIVKHLRLVSIFL